MVVRLSLHFHCQTQHSAITQVPKSGGQGPQCPCCQAHTGLELPAMGLGLGVGTIVRNKIFWSKFFLQAVPLRRFKFQNIYTTLDPGPQTAIRVEIESAYSLLSSLTPLRVSLQISPTSVFFFFFYS